MIEKTLAIIKPDAVSRGLTGDIITRIENEGFTILEILKIKPWRETIKNFYIEHKDKPFYNDLVNFMSSGKIVVMVLQREDAIAHWRKTMGATNSGAAQPDTIRGKYGSREVVMHNCVHGSDSIESAKREIELFFLEVED